MSLQLFRSVALCLLAAGACAVLPGCSSSPDAKETVGSMSEFGVEIAKVKDSIDGSLMALDTVVKTPTAEARANFDAYARSVAALDKQGNVVRGRANEMKEKGDEFFKEWDDSAEMTPARREELTASYARIKEEMTLAKEEFTPFLASLKDIEKYLRLDLSPKGLESTAGLVKQAQEHGARVKSRIDGVLMRLNTVRGMLSTKQS